MTDWTYTFTDTVNNPAWDLLTPLEKSTLIALEHLMSIYPEAYTVDTLALLTDNLMLCDVYYLYFDGLVNLSSGDPHRLATHKITDDRAESPNDSVEIHWSKAGVKLTVSFESVNIADIAITVSSAELVTLVEGISQTGPEKKRAIRRVRQQ